MEAGKIAGEALKWGAKKIKPNASYLDVADAIEKRISDAGAGIPFPTNISVNDIAAHYVPRAQDASVFGENDVVKLDIGCDMDGYIADCATTVDLGGAHSKMIEANMAALDAAIDLVRPGACVSKIGEAVQTILNDAGFKPIENLTGHQMKRRELHAGLSIPNIKVPYDWEIEEGMVLALEPFATCGAGHVIESPGSQIYSLMEYRPVRVSEARKLLSEIRKRQELPFAARWYSKMIPPHKLGLILNQLSKQEILRAYPPLHDRAGGVVTQFEHTVIVEDSGCTVTTA